MIFTACAAPQPTLTSVTLKLNWEAGVEFLGFYVAHEKGYYAEEDLDVRIEPLSILSEGPNVPFEVAEGKYQFSIGGADVIPAQLEGVPVTEFASFYKLRPLAFFTRADSGINTPADFARRTVVIKGLPWEDRLTSMLEPTGLTLADVELVPGGFDMTPFLEGEVEVWAGFLTNEAVRARLAGIEIITFPLYEYTPRKEGLTVYTSQEILQNDRELAVRFLRASIRGWNWAINNPTEAVDIFLARFPDKAPEREFHQASFQSAIPLILPRGETLGAIDCDLWNSDQAFQDLPSTKGFCTLEIFQAATE